VIGKLEDLFIKVWRAASILSVLFSGLIAVSMTKDVDQAGVRFLVVVGVVIIAAVFAGFTAWAMRLMEGVRSSNVVAEKQLRLSAKIYQQMLKEGSARNQVSSQESNSQ